MQFEVSLHQQFRLSPFWSSLILNTDLVAQSFGGSLASVGAGCWDGQRRRRKVGREGEVVDLRIAASSKLGDGFDQRYCADKGAADSNSCMKNASVVQIELEAQGLRVRPTSTRNRGDSSYLVSRYNLLIKSNDRSQVNPMHRPQQTLQPCVSVLRKAGFSAKKPRSHCISRI